MMRFPSTRFSRPPARVVRAIIITIGVWASTFDARASAGVNDAPVIDATKSPALAPQKLNDPVPTGAVGTPVSSLVDFDTPVGQVDNVSDGDSTDGDAAPVLGIAITAADAVNGTWYYSINNGSTWLTLGSPTSTAARLLDATSSRLYFKPISGFSGTSSITFRAWDRTTGTIGGTASTSSNGGTTAYSTATDTASVTVGIIFRGVATGFDAGGATSSTLVFTTPGGTAPNDVMLTTLAVRPDTTVITAPAGWTLIRRTDNATVSAHSLATYYRFAGSSEPSSYTWGISVPTGTLTGAVGGIQSYSGIDITSPIDVSAGATTASSLTHTAPSVTATVANSLLFTFFAFGSSSTWTPPSTSPTTFEIFDLMSAAQGSTGISMAGDVQSLTATGATGTRASTAASDADAGTTQSIVVRPIANTAPVLDATKSPALGTVSEDPGAPAGAVGTLVSSLVDFASPSGQNDNVTDPDSSALLGIAITATDANGTWFYSTNNGGNWSAVGTVSHTSARLLAADANTRIYFQPTANFNGTLSAAITFRAWDQTSGANGDSASVAENGGSTAFSTTTDTANLTVTAVNDAPTASNLSAAETYTEDTALNLVDIVVADVDSTTVTATLTLSTPSAGALSTATSGTVTSTYVAGTGVWTASGAIASVNTLLAGVTFTPTANGNGSFTIATSISDGSLSATGNKSVTGTAINDAPTATNLSTAETYTEDTALNLVDIVVSDIDSATVTATLTLSSPSAGSLNTGTSGAVTSTYVAGTGVWTASGAIASVNILLAGVTFTPAANANGSFTIATSVSDGVAAAITGNKSVTGTAVNDAPTATNLSAAESYTEDTALNLVDIVASDIDSATVTATLTLSTPSAGALSTATSGAVTSSYDSGTGVWSAAGPIANVNTLLAGVTFTPATNFSSSFTIATSIDDGTGATASGTKSVTANPVNDAPVLDASKTPTMSTVSEDPGAPSGAVGTLVSSLVDFAAVPGQLDNVSDVDSSAVLGIAITAIDPNFTGYYSLNGGTTWTSFGSVSTATSRLLTADADNRIYLQPNLNVNGTFPSAITFRAWDQTSGTDGGTADTTTTGGSTAFSSATDGLAQVVTAVNDAPTATNLSASESYTEDTALNLIDIAASDVDNATVTATLTLSTPSAGNLNTATSGAVTSSYDSGTGVWSAAGAIADVNTLLAGVIFTPAANGNGSFTIATSVSDGALSVTGTKSVTGTAVNDAPTATNLSAAESYTEDTALNLVDIVVTDVDSTVTATLALSTPSAGALSTATSGAVTSTYVAGTGVWTASGAVADVNTLLAGVTFTPAANFTQSFTIATSVSDGVAVAITGTKSVTGIAVNDAPTATNLSATESYTEDTSLNLVDIVVTDVDSTITATLTLSTPSAGSLSTSTSGAVTSTYVAGTGVWTASGAVADVNTLLASVTFTPAANANGSFTIATSVSDGVAAAITGTKAVTGTAVNDAPVLDASKTPTLSTITEDAGAPSGAVGTLVSSLVDFSIPAGGLDNVSEVDSGAVLGVAVTAIDANFTGYYSLNGGTTWTAFGSLTTAAARLLAADADNRIYLQPNLDLNGTFASALTFRAWDQISGTDGATADTTTTGGATPFSSTTDGMRQIVTAVNDSPTATNLSAAESYTEDTALNLIDIVVSDVDSAIMTATLTLSDTNAGSLSTATSGAVTSTYDSSTGIWTASGAIADINTLLAGVVFTPAINYNSTISIATSVDDGAGGTTSGSKLVTGTPVNDAPVLDASITPTLSTIAEDTGAPSGAVGTLVSSLVDFSAPAGGLDNVSDVDSGSVLGIAITATSGTCFYSTDNGGHWIAIGTVSSASARLLAADAATRIYFQPAANVNGILNATITFRAWDRTSGANGGFASVTANGGSTAFSTATDTASLTVTPVNDAPVLDASKTPTLSTVAEDAGAPSGAMGVLVSSLVDLTVPTGQLDNVSEVDSGALLGIAITATDNTSGTWYYSTDNGGSWSAVGAVSSASARLLAANATTRIYFQPSADFSGTLSAAISFLAWDQTSGANGGSSSVIANGGTTAFSAATDTASLTVTPVNDAPLLDASKTPTLSPVAEDATAPSGAVGTLVSSLVDFSAAAGGLDNVSDVDSGSVLGIAITATDNTSGTWYYSTDNGGSWSAVGAVSSASARLLAANANNRIYFQPSADFSGTLSAAISFLAWDQTSGANGGSSSVIANGGTTAFSAATDTASLTVIPVNDAPLLDASKTPILSAVAEDAAAPSGAVGTLVSSLEDFSAPAGGLDNVSDVDSGALLGIAVTGIDANFTGYYSLNGGTTWSAFDVVSATNAQLLATSAVRIYLRPNSNVNGTFVNAITFRAWDQTTGINGATADTTSNGGSSAFSSATDGVTQIVVPVNDAPVLDTSKTPTMSTVAENPGAPAGVVGTLVSSLVDFDVPAGGIDNITEADSGAVLGIAVTAIDSNFTGYYSLNNGTTWIAFGAVSTSSSRLLSTAGARIYLQPNLNVKGTFANAMTFRAWDQTSGSNGGIADTTASGGTTAFSSANDGVTQIVTPVSSPVILTLATNQTPGTFAFSLSGDTGVYQIQTSSDLTNWTTWKVITNTAGTANITDSSPTNSFRFYKALFNP